MERTSTPIGTADAHILFTTAVRKSRSPGQTAAPGGVVTQLPSTDHVVKRTAGITHKLFAFPEGELVDRAENPYLVAVEIHRPPCNAVIDRIVGAVVAVGVRIGVVRDELQAAGESLLHLYLECIVGAGGVIAVV